MLLFYCIYFFIIGAFLGWVLECVFKASAKHFERAPGILYSPFCILYGIGTVILATVIPSLSSNIFWLFIFSAVILTIFEYITYVLLDKMYGIHLWDYSNMKFALNDKVCIEFAAIWGILGVVFIKYLLPIFSNIFLKLNGTILYLIVFVIFTLIAIDLLYTNDKLIRERKV